jgi:CDP-diacylglycerol--glycerol-3-phosphate 3-phosphatidyltransferase
MLVAGRFMRGFYGVLKALAFAMLLLLQPLDVLAPAWWASWREAAWLLADGLVLASVAVCLLRGIPVVAEFARSHGAADRASGRQR